MDGKQPPGAADGGPTTQRDGRSTVAGNAYDFD
jgi:hypothetical protein